MKKNNSHLLAITILFLLPILLVGCNKNTVQGGAEIGYPYSCSISGNGTVTVKLDGSASPDYTWYVSSDDVAVVTVSKKGMETNGKATFKITKLNKKGKFKAKITFKATKYYKSITKKVKIIIK